MPRLTSILFVVMVTLHTRFAQNEFEHGSVERGRSVFEGLMASYPKRLDLWNVYLDKEIKAGDLRASRNLLERLVRKRKRAQPKFWDHTRLIVIEAFVFQQVRHVGNFVSKYGGFLPL